MKKMTAVLSITMILSTGFASEKAASIEKTKSELQFVCETVGKYLPQEYRPTYRPANAYSPQSCQIYSVGFDQSISFNMLQAFNAACVSDDSTSIQIAPAPCNDELKTCVLNIRCAPKN